MFTSYNIDIVFFCLKTRLTHVAEEKKKSESLFTERRISVAGNIEANSCQLSTLNMGMIRENINIFDINVKPP